MALSEDDVVGGRVKERLGVGVSGGTLNATHTHTHEHFFEFLKKISK